MSSTLVMCIAQPQNAGQVQLTVASSQGDIVSNAVSFGYMPASSVQSVVPTGGPANAGEMITVIGMHFTDGDAAACKVGDTKLTAMVITSSMMHCSLPSLAPGSYAVGFSYGDVVSEGSVRFTVTNLIEMTGVLGPTSGSLGGGTLLTVVGIGFDAGGVVCSFGNETATTRMVSSSMLLCTAPSGKVGASLNRKVGVMRADGVEVPSVEAYFKYTLVPRVTKVVPSMGPSSGRSAVMVYGEHLSTEGGVLCSFGGQVSEGASMSSSMVRCLTPELSLPGEMSVEVSTNGEGFSREGVKYHVQEAPVILAMRPSAGPEVGGTAITLLGSRFWQSSEVFCRFGFGAAVVIGEMVSQTELVCTSPARSPGNLSIAPVISPA